MRTTVSKSYIVPLEVSLSSDCLQNLTLTYRNLQQQQDIQQNMVVQHSSIETAVVQMSGLI